MKLMLKITACILLSWMLIFYSCMKEYSYEGGKNNKPPLAVAGPDTVITLPTDSVLLNGSKSSDPDGKISAWQWTKLTGPASFTIVSATAAITTVKNLKVGTYQFELKVTDDEGASARDTVMITVDSIATGNHPPVACAGADRTITLPTDTVTLDGSCSTDPDNNISSYLWTKVAGPASVTMGNANAATILVSNLTEGVYQFELKVTDAGGLFSKDTVQVTVQPAQQGCGALNRATITIQLVPVAAIPTPRYAPTTATAGNKLLLAGGWAQPGDQPVSDVKIYDFGTQTWSTAHLSIARANMTAIRVGDKIFFVAGEVPGIAATTRVDIYDASTNTWSVSDLPSPASIVWSYAVVGNKVFFVTNRAPFGRVDVYDTSTGLWSAIDLPQHQGSATAAPVGNKIYFAGGWVNYPINNLSNVVNVYDNATGTWSTTSSLSQPTDAMASIYVNGKIYWAGGIIGYDAAHDKDILTCKVEIRDVSTGISLFTNLSAPRDFEGNDSKPIYYNNKIIFQDWWGNNQFDIYDPQSSTWSIGQFPQNGSIESVILVNNALYAIVYNDTGSGLSGQIWKLQY
jgi:hypothetical protein